MAAPAISHDAAGRRFDLGPGGESGRLEYRLGGGVMTIVHTEVATEREGQGLGGALVRAALDHARGDGLKVDPQCAYAAAYMHRHPESMALHV
jgi:predicted GNAT family acetyltransferase